MASDPAALLTRCPPVEYEISSLHRPVLRYRRDLSQVGLVGKYYIPGTGYPDREALKALPDNLTVRHNK